MTYLLPPNESQLEFIKKEDTWRPASELDEDVTRLIEWLSQQPHLPNITDRSWLSHFIPGCKYNLQRTKEVIESYFVRRAEFPEFFEPYTMEEIRASARFGMICMFPKMTPEGYRIFCVTTKQSDDENNFDAMLFSKVVVSVQDVQMKVEPMHGNVLLYDLKHFTLSRFLTFTPTITKKLLTVWLNSFPLRLKCVHITNPPKFIDRALTFFKMFCPAKLKNRIFVHSSMEDLHKYLPKDILPDVFGGTNGTFEQYTEDAFKLYENNREWLKAQPKADLSRRPGRHTDADEWGMDGTFKKLQID